MARCRKVTKAAATEVLEKLFVTLAGEAPDREEARGDAIVALSMMIGAMTLARIVADSDLSSENPGSREGPPDEIAPVRNVADTA
jgi:TetR/AcrR family transcriptional repressor of nem operon